MHTRSAGHKKKSSRTQCDLLRTLHHPLTRSLPIIVTAPSSRPLRRLLHHLDLYNNDSIIISTSTFTMSAHSQQIPMADNTPSVINYVGTPLHPDSFYIEVDPQHAVAFRERFYFECLGHVQRIPGFRAIHNGLMVVSATDVAASDTARPAHAAFQFPASQSQVLPPAGDVVGAPAPHAHAVAREATTQAAHDHLDAIAATTQNEPVRNDDDLNSTAGYTPGAGQVTLDDFLRNMELPELEAVELRNGAQTPAPRATTSAASEFAAAFPDTASNRALYNAGTPAASEFAEAFPDTASNRALYEADTPAPPEVADFDHESLPEAEASRCNGAFPSKEVVLGGKWRQVIERSDRFPLHCKVPQSVNLVRLVDMLNSKEHNKTVNMVVIVRSAALLQLKGNDRFWEVRVSNRADNAGTKAVVRFFTGPDDDVAPLTPLPGLPIDPEVVLCALNVVYRYTANNEAIFCVMRSSRVFVGESLLAAARLIKGLL